MEELIQYLLWSTFFIVIAFLFTRHGSSINARLPPGPRPLPVLGNLLELGTNPHRSLARLARTHGPVMYLKLGIINTLVISSPSSAKEVLKTKEHATSGRQIPHVAKTLDHNEFSVVFSPPNKSWRYLRTLMKTHLFNTKSLDATQPLRRQKVQELLAYVRGENGVAVDIGRASFCTVLNLMSTSFMSIDMVDLKSQSAQELKDLISAIFEEVGRPNISDFFPVLSPLDLQGRRRRATKYIKKLFDFFDRIIENRLAGESTRIDHDILDSLLQLHLEDDSKLSKKTLRSFLLDSFIAGSETSSTTIEWVMAELLRRPELMKRARDELTNVIGFEKEVDEADLSRLPFLQAVLKETFRLHPPGPFLVPHKVETCTEINGFAVPKNTQVLVNVWAIGRDERIWENPDLFAPERFMGGGEIDFLGQHYELLPFGSGRRICPGILLGVRMVQLIVASLIHSFEWHLPDGITPEDLDLKEKFGLTLVLASPLKALATPAAQI